MFDTTQVDCPGAVFTDHSSLRADKRPTISDLLWVETLDPVDQILFLYRGDYYKNLEDERDNIAEFILAKHPAGKSGIATAACHPTANSFLLYTGL